MKEIKLKNGETTIVDDDDFDYLSKHKWYLSKHGYAIGCEKRNNIKSFAKIHRIIMGINDPSIKIDHVNGNKLDNRKNNLRIASNSQNVHNSAKRKNTSNSFKGVNYVHRIKLWQSRCRMNNCDYFLGHFSSEIAAAYAYNKKAIELSEYSRINYLPYNSDYLESILISHKVTKLLPIQSKYKYIYYKTRKNRMKCDKWYISFLLNGERKTKGNFATENEALEYLVNNFNDILIDAGNLK